VFAETLIKGRRQRGVQETAKPPFRIGQSYPITYPSGDLIMPMLDTLSIDLSDLAIQDIEVLAHEGSRGMREFAASSCENCICQTGGCSCVAETEA
jgi:hypothetical protein